MTSLQFNQQVEQIESLLFGFAMRLTRDKENAKDLMQETLMRCFNKRDRFQMGTNFKSWATTVMYNAYINIYRRKKTKNKVVKPIEDFNYLVENKSKEGSTDSIMMMKELNATVNSLSDDFKIPFQMFIDGFHYEEIANELEPPLGTIKSRIFYARKKLRNLVKTNFGIRNFAAA